MRDPVRHGAPAGGPIGALARRCGRGTVAASSRQASLAFTSKPLRWLADRGGRGWTTATAGASAFDDAPAAACLLVDDNADMREYVGRLLAARRAGWSRRWRDGEAALAAARHDPPDLVLQRRDDAASSTASACCARSAPIAHRDRRRSSCCRRVRARRRGSKGSTPAPTTTS